jgi:glucose 1-dehydrogenase
MRLDGKVAVVTGAGSGIGESIATRFAEEGARVVINYRPGGKHNGNDVVQALTKRGLNAIAVAANVTSRPEIENLFAETERAFGGIDIVVSNAGIEIKRPFIEVTDEEWNKVLGVNLYGAFLVSQAGARAMVRHGKPGKIIFVSSVHEDIPFPGYSSYCASKGAIRMLMRNLSIELAPHKINVNDIAPGAIATPINQRVLADPQQKRNALSEIPWDRFGKPEDVAAVALFLASAEADYVTGSTYYVDGGLTQQVTRY